MSDAKEYKKIAKMSVAQLLDYVLGAPYLLTDSYYRGFDTAIYKRHKELAMPWTPSSGPSRHTKKASTPAKKKAWSATANAVLKKTGDEGRAVRIANSVVKKKKGKK